MIQIKDAEGDVVVVKEKEIEAVIEKGCVKIFGMDFRDVLYLKAQYETRGGTFPIAPEGLSLFRHPSRYWLVRKIADGKLFRIMPGSERPHGYEAIDQIIEGGKRIPVYESKALAPRFWSLPRLHIEVEP